MEIMGDALLIAYAARQAILTAEQIITLKELQKASTTQTCEEKTDYCLDSSKLIEYYISGADLETLVYTCHCKNGQAGCCYDGRCVECTKDSDCPAGGPDNLVVGKCDTSGAVTGKAYTCYWPACVDNSYCVAGACCDRDPAIPEADRGSGTCNWKGSGTSRIYKNKYLCVSP
ncbi:MAG: hypothetical protein FGF51_08185 [Candidatus Brockarchaeota archaeon]|nr:hypothetical protein [Candidatus Brockarchaeota archaeon]